MEWARRGQAPDKSDRVMVTTEGEAFAGRQVMLFSRKWKRRAELPVPEWVDPAVKIAGAMGAAFAWAYQARATVLRGKIRADLEILEKTKALFPEDDPRILSMEQHVGRLMGYLYRTKKASRQRGSRVMDFGIGAVCLTGALGFLNPWPWDLADPPSWWSAISAAVLVFVAVGAVLNGLDSEEMPGE